MWEKKNCNRRQLLKKLLTYKTIEITEYRFSWAPLKLALLFQLGLRRKSEIIEAKSTTVISSSNTKSAKANHSFLCRWFHHTLLTKLDHVLLCILIDNYIVAALSSCNMESLRNQHEADFCMKFCNSTQTPNPREHPTRAISCWGDLNNKISHQM